MEKSIFLEAGKVEGFFFYWLRSSVIRTTKLKVHVLQECSSGNIVIQKVTKVITKKQPLHKICCFVYDDMRKSKAFKTVRSKNDGLSIAYQPAHHNGPKKKLRSYVYSSPSGTSYKLIHRTTTHLLLRWVKLVTFFFLQE
jgi:hypothetical protein